MKIFQVEKQFPWMQSHCQVPTVMFHDNCYRMYFATRNSENKSVIACIDIESKRFESHKIYDKPILEPGEAGRFDALGVMPASVVSSGDSILLYYSGMGDSKNFPYSNGIGLAISADGGKSFMRYSRDPIFDCDSDQSLMCFSPTVIFHNDVWHMWYSSGDAWYDIDGSVEPHYSIKHAVSADAINWEATQGFCNIALDEDEVLTRPNVIMKNGHFHMWFCHRRMQSYRDGVNAYRIAYAYSNNGIDWIRDNDWSRQLLVEDWDDKMQAYPFVLSHDNQDLLFYSGNDFGMAGVGCQKITF